MTMAVLKLKSSDGTYLNYTLDKPITTLGRSKTNDIIVDDTSISRLHVRLENRNGQYFVIDNNSSNGTYLNRRKISTAPLQDGDTLIAGQVQFHFSHKVIGGLKTQSLPLMDSKENFGRQDQTMAVPYPEIPANDQTLSNPTPRDIAPPAPIPIPQQKPPIVPPPFSQAPPTPPGAQPPPAPTPSPSYQTILDPELFDVASPFSRLIALILDGLLVLFLCVPSIILAAIGQNILSLIFSLLALIAAVVNLFGGWFKYGKTFGKHLMGIRIVDLANPQKQGLGVPVIFKRLLGQMICSFTFNLLFLTILFDDEGRGFHDKFSNTKVVKY